MKAHRTDGVSLVFALIFLALAGWWLLAQIMDLALPAVGWFLAGALILIGVLGLFGALRSARSTPSEVTPSEVTPPEVTLPESGPPATDFTTGVGEPAAYPTAGDPVPDPAGDPDPGPAPAGGPGPTADDPDPTLRLSTDRE